MDSLSHFSDEELVAFFRHKKTAISIMKGLDIFLNQLKDDGLLPTEQHEILIKAKAKQKPVYEFLNSLEKERPQCIRSFWRCVFQEHMVEIYPRLSVFKASLYNGSFRSDMENHSARKITQNQTMKMTKKRKNSGDDLKTSFGIPSSQNTPAKRPKTSFLPKNQSFVNKEGKKLKKTAMEKKKEKTFAGKKKIEKEKPAGRPKQEKQKKTPTKKTVKNVKTSTETKKTKKEKPAKSPSSLGSNPLKIPPKPKKTTTNKNSAVTSKKSAEKLKQGMKPGPSPCLKPDQKEPDFDFYSELELCVNELEKNKKKNKTLISTKTKNLIKSAKTAKTTKSAQIFLPVGEKKQDMPSVTLFQSPLFVTCGEKAGVLHPDKLARGERCIWVEDCWVTPNEFQKFGGKMNNKNWKQSIRHDNKPLQKFIESGQLQIPPTKKNHAQESKVESKPGSSLSLGPHMFDAKVENQDTKVMKKPKLEVRSQHSEDIMLPVFVAKVENQDTNVMKKPKLEVKSQHSEDIMLPGSSAKTHVQVFGINNSVKNQICCICKTSGASVSCCDCQQSFHTHCHLPNLQAETQRYKWMCTFCVWRSSRGLWRPMTENQALDSPVTSYNMQCDYLIMYILRENKFNFFADCIIRAERLNKVKLKLRNKEYQTVKEFVNELKIIFLVYSFITQNTESWREGCRLSKIFEEEFQKVFNIQ